MSNERINLTRLEDMVAEEECLNLEGANGYDMCDMARTLIAELNRCYEEIDQLRETAQRLAQAHIGVYGLDD